jgi:hypothetical protein
VELRDELQPRPVTEAELARVVHALRAVQWASDTGGDPVPGCADLAAALRRPVDPADVCSLLAAMTAEQVARDLLARPRRVPGVTRAELIEIARRMSPHDDAYDADNEAHWRKLFNLTAGQNASALLYSPPPGFRGEFEDWAPTAEELVDLATRVA